jgi:WD40 repeat protein
VGASRSSLFPPTKVVIWDDNQMSIAAELRFNSQVKSLRLRRETFAVVLEENIFVYNMSDLSLKDILKTFNNRKGLCCLNATGEDPIIAYLEEPRGSIAIKNYSNLSIRLIHAFESTISFMEMNLDGSLIACTGENGKIIKVFNTEKKELMFQLHRGIDKAEIFSIAFHTTSEWLAVSSDRGTIHVYKIVPSEKKKEIKFIKKIVPKYFESESSYSQFKVKDCKMICCFGKDSSTLIIITDDNEYFAVNYSEGGVCRLLEKYNLLEFN